MHDEILTVDEVRWKWQVQGWINGRSVWWIRNKFKNLLALFLHANIIMKVYFYKSFPPPPMHALILLLIIIHPLYKTLRIKQDSDESVVWLQTSVWSHTTISLLQSSSRNNFRSLRPLQGILFCTFDSSFVSFNVNWAVAFDTLLHLERGVEWVFGRRRSDTTHEQNTSDLR